MHIQGSHAIYRVFSLTWPASMQIYWSKRNRLHKVWDTNMAAVSLFWDTNMAAVTSCENTLYLLACSAGVFWAGKSCLFMFVPLCLLRRRKISESKNSNSPHFLPSFEFQHALSRAKHSRARRKRPHCRLYRCFSQFST